MKLLNAFVLLICMLTMVVAKPLNDPSSFNISTPAQQLVKYYDHEHDLLAQEICPKIKNITDEILKDDIVQKSIAPLMQVVKKNLTEFQRYYPYFKSFGYNGTLVSEFSDMIQGFYYPSRYENDNAFPYIQQLLKKLGYDDIRANYMEKFKIFFEEKFLKKIEEVQAEIVNQSKDREYDLHVLKWTNFLRTCQEYECFLVNYQHYKRIHGKFVDRLFGEIFRHITKTIVINVDNTTIFARAVLEDPKLSQLSAPVKQQLTKNLQDIIKLQENCITFPQIFYSHVIFYYILYRFDDYADISPEERQLITSIFNNHEYKGLHFEESKKKLVETDYIKIYETRQAALSPKDLEQQKSFLEAVDRLTSASGAHEKVKAVENLEKLLHNN